MSIIAPFTSATDRGYKFLRVFDQYYGGRGDLIGLQVEGGVSPYSWVITGTDFTLDAASTVGQFNFVTVDAAAVLDNIETVTVTDAEGSTVDIIVCTCNPSVCCEAADYAFDGTYTVDKSVAEMVPLKCSKIRSASVGCAPYRWVSNNSNFELAREYTNGSTNLICATASATVSSTIDVTLSDVNECCCEQIDYVAPTIDAANTDDTIDNATPAVVTIVDGCAPFVWSVSGTGYTISPNGSSDLQAATVSVVAGVCEVNYGATCTVTVTDACSTVVTKTIRNTGGQWVGHGACVASCSGGASCIDAGNCLFSETKTVTEGTDQWVYGSSFNCRTGASVCVWLSSGLPCTEPNPSVCTDPISCATYFEVGPCACEGTSGLCRLGTLTHYVWGCP